MYNVNTKRYIVTKYKCLKCAEIKQKIKKSKNYLTSFQEGLSFYQSAKRSILLQFIPLFVYQNCIQNNKKQILK